MPDRLYAGALEEDTGIVRLPWHSRTFHQLYNIQFLLNTTHTALATFMLKCHRNCFQSFHLHVLHLHVPFLVDWDAYLGLLMKS